MTSLASLGLASGAVAVEASPAAASEAKVYTTTDNVWLHADPGLGDKDDLIKTMPKGTRFTADCYVNDTPIGERNNPAWLHGTDETGTTGYFTDYYSDSHWSKNNTLHDQGLAFCGEKPAAVREKASDGSATDVKACFFNLKAPSNNLTFSYGGNHRYLGNAWQAAKNWTDAGVGINIKQTSAKNAYIRFKDVYSNGGFFARAVIPETTEWMGPHKTPPKNPKRPSHIVIEMNQRTLDMRGMGDFQRTYAAGHEIGHTLGAAHPELCEDHSSVGLMNAGNFEEIKSRIFNTPMPYDKRVIKQLYQ